MAKSKEAATIGDNSSHSFAKEQLASIISRIENLETEKQAVSEDIREVYNEAHGNGFDKKAIRAIIKMRKQDADERAEQAAIIDLYASALGMFATTPLGAAAIERATAAPSRSRQPAKLEIEKILDAG